MPRIPKHIIDDIYSRIDIEGVIGDFVSLKKKGQNFMARCPFHDEKTASFSVSPQKGIYKCFGCGKGGDAINFIMEIEGGSYFDAMVYLANKYGIPIEYQFEKDEDLIAQNERESMMIVTSFAKNFFVKQMYETDEGKSIGLSYFKERGFTDETIQKFELGYSPERRDSFFSEAVKAGFKELYIEKAGLCINKENRFFDRFSGRVIFPIHNVSGKVIAFGARTLSADKNIAKYLNSPDSDIYHKNEVLFGLYQAKNEIRKESICYLVEGYTDVISLHQAGVENVCASAGTSLTENQIRLLNRYTQHIALLYDGDSAGIKAAIRGLELILEKGLDVSVIVLPDKDDPDSFSRKHSKDEIRSFLKKNSKDFITFKTSLILDEIKDHPLKKAEAINEIISTIAKIPDIIKRAVFIKQCSRMLEVEENILLQSLNNLLLQSKSDSEYKNKIFKENIQKVSNRISPVDHSQKNTSIPNESSEREILRLMLNYGEHLLENNESLTTFLLSQIEDMKFHVPIYSKIINLIKKLAKEGERVSPEYFLRLEDEEIQKSITDLITTRDEPSKSWIEKFKIEIPKEADQLTKIASIAQLRMQWKQLRLFLVENHNKMRFYKNENELFESQKVHIYLKGLEKAIVKQLGIVVY